MTKYILEEVPKRSFVSKHPHIIPNILAISITVGVGVFFWNDVEVDKKVAYVMGLFPMALLLMCIFGDVSDVINKR